MFIFLVDRSGSMSGSKMKTTKEALVLFLKSLPLGSYFEIISFGYNFETMSGGNIGFKYDDKTLKLAIDKIINFSANLGGTNIWKPLKYAIVEIETSLEKRIFLLTDGEDEDK